MAGSMDWSCCSREGFTREKLTVTVTEAPSVAGEAPLHTYLGGDIEMSIDYRDGGMQSNI